MTPGNVSTPHPASLPDQFEQSINGACFPSLQYRFDTLPDQRGLRCPQSPCQRLQAPVLIFTQQYLYARHEFCA